LLTDIDRAAALLRAPFLKQDVILAAVRSPGYAVAGIFFGPVAAPVRLPVPPRMSSRRALVRPALREDRQDRKFFRKAAAGV